jgi:integrase
MKSSRGVKVVRKRLADGTIREYRYDKNPVRSPRFAPDSLDALLQAYRRSPEWAALANSTRATYTVYLRVLDRLGNQKVREIRRKELLGLRDAVAIKRGNGAGTGFQRAASALLGWAVDRGWIDYHPLLRARALPHGHLREWSESDIAHALAHLDEPYRRVVVLALHTGQRRSDVIALTWGQYDGAAFRLRQQKTRTPLIVPAHPDLRAELATWQRSQAVILTSPQGRPWTPAHLSRSMKARLEAIGLPDINVHGLRKAAARRLAEAGATAHEIAAVTGHKSLSMVQLYTASADQRRLAESAVERLETARQKLGRKPAVKD